MAEILKARDLGQPGAPIVAVKRILPHLTEDRQYVTMFLDESRVLAQLEHDNVIRTLAVGQVDETPFIALEFVFGPDARMVFHKSRRTEQPIPMSIACYVMAQVCAALHYAHERQDEEGNPLGLVHRDVSLQNVLLSYDGAVKLTDFGIAKSGVNVARTEAGVVKGKFGYMAPEQVMSQPMDRRSDVFSAGICLYELLTGERLFSGDSDYQAVERVRNVRIEPPSRYNRMIPSTLEAIVMKALSKAPRDRFQTASEMRRALLAFMADSGQECSARQLGQYLRALFADELARRPNPDSLGANAKPVARDPSTGLAAFDDLDAPSGLREALPEQAAAAVATVATDGEATRVGAPPAADLAASAAPEGNASNTTLGADPWPEPTFASNAGAFGAQLGPERPVFEPGDDDRTQVLMRDALDGMGDDDVTRQIFVGQALSGSPRPAQAMAPEPAPAAARTRDSQRPQRAARTPMPFEQVAATPYGLVIAVVTTILAVIVLVLVFARGARPAAVHIVTLPPSPEVLVDGQRARGHESPFVIDGLEPEVDHLIEVRAPGFHTWSTRLMLEPGQSLALPLVTLVPSAAVEKPRAAARPARPAPVEAQAPKIRETPAPPEAPSTSARPAASASRPGAHSPAREAERPRKEPEPTSAAAAAQPFGTLRVNSRPWSTVSVDGKRVGNTPLLDLRVSPGTHVIELHNPELRLKKKLSVRVRAGQTVTRVVSLP